MSEKNGIRTGEILFVKSVKDGIPNRDPLRDSDARRIFGEDDGCISLSDVSIKRDVRDYVLAQYPDGGEEKNLFIFVRKEFADTGNLLGREKLALTLLERAGKQVGKEVNPADLFEVAYDVRVFGAVFSVRGQAFNQTGPVQFGWAHSLHPVESKYVQGTVVMPSEEQGKGMGTIWTTYIVPFAVFAMPGVVSAPIAESTGMTQTDLDLLLEGLWKGTIARQARGRGIQQPLLLLHVEYKDPFFRLGFLEEGVAIKPGRDAWLGGNPPTSLDEITLDVTALAERLEKNRDKISRIRLWKEPKLKLEGEIDAELCAW